VRRALLIVAALAVGGGVAAIPSSGASTKTVLVKDDVFSPAKLTISKGTKVQWLWRGKRRHNIAVANGPSNFRAGTRRKGSFEKTFKKTGRYSIVCTIHAPDMHMVIKVK
jgi:plastocyanin